MYTGVQLLPPLPVRSTRPPDATTNPVSCVTNETPIRADTRLTGSTVQVTFHVVPPSVVANISPWSLTANPDFSSRKKMSRIDPGGQAYCTRQPETGPGLYEL